MNRQARRRLEKRAAILKVLPNPARLMLLEELSHGECCVCDLHHRAGGDFSTVSRHLGQLRRAGLLEAEKRGLQVFHRLKSRCALRLLKCADELIQVAGKEVRR
ncbi:MAG: ArsR/SmtB family transcription factor [Acidobacteriota bacterium]